MAHGFRISGNYIYCSKASTSSDANDGLTPETAKLTAVAAINAIGSLNGVIFGSGVYEENINLTGGSVRSMHADGKVIFKATGSNQFLFNGGQFSWNGPFEFHGYTAYGNTGNTSLYTYSGSATGAKIKFKNVVFSGRAFQFNHCEFDGCSGGSQSFANYGYSASKFINSQVSGGLTTTVVNCDYDENSTCYVHLSNSTETPNSFTYSNIRGPVTYRISGSSAVNYATLADFQTAKPTYFANSFSLDPLYNNKAGNDLTVSPLSPNIRAGSSASNIGSVITGTSHWVDATIKPANPAFVPVSEGGEAFYSPELQTSAGGVSIVQPNTSGYIITGAIDVSNGKNAEITNIRLPNNLEFNASFTGPNIRNMNVPDANAGTLGAADRNPNRLSVFMRWTTSTLKPTTDAEWENQAYIPAGEWGLFNLFEKPMVDLAGKTSGLVDFAYAATDNRFIMAKWVQFKIVLINNYAR